MNLVLELGGARQVQRSQLTAERRIQLPPDWARQLLVDTIAVQGRNGVYVVGYFHGVGCCSLATFEEVRTALGWDAHDVPEFGSPDNPVRMKGERPNACRCMYLVLPQIWHVTG